VSYNQFCIKTKTIKKSSLVGRLFIGSSSRLIFDCHQGDCSRCIFDNKSEMRACNAMVGTIGITGKYNCSGVISAIKDLKTDDVSYNDFINITAKFRRHGN